jgi:hypothetical protein
VIIFARAVLIASSFRCGDEVYIVDPVISKLVFPANLLLKDLLLSSGPIVKTAIAILAFFICVVLGNHRE